MKQLLQRTFEFERDTKRTYRFKEVTQNGLDTIGVLYVQKHVFGGAPVPTSVVVTMEIDK